VEWRPPMDAMVTAFSFESTTFLAEAAEIHY
jgi:hypothetical protein